MAISVSDRFRRLITAIQPGVPELDAAARRLDRIRNRLADDFETRRSVEVGSHWKGTAVRRHSDVDLFVVMSRDEARKWAPEMRSSTLLNRVRRSVRRSYPQNDIRISGQAVVVPFEQGAHSIDVVPAIFDSFVQELASPRYFIPNGDDGWLTTAPDAQRQYLEDRHARSGRKLKSLVRMLKWWGAARFSTYGFTSLFIEHFVAESGVALDATYQEALAQLLLLLAESDGGIADPLQLSGSRFMSARTDSQRRAIKKAAQMCAPRADHALAAEARGRDDIAISYWESVFNGSFPSRLPR